MEKKFDPRPEFRLFLVDMLDVYGKGDWLPIEESKNRITSVVRRLFDLNRLDVATDLVCKLGTGGFVPVGNGYRFQLDVADGQRYLRFERDI